MIVECIIQPNIQEKKRNIPVIKRKKANRKLEDKL